MNWKSECNVSRSLVRVVSSVAKMDDGLTGQAEYVMDAGTVSEVLGLMGRG